MHKMFYAQNALALPAQLGYGYLYNGAVVTDTRNVANTDWHTPTTAEWNVLSLHLGGDSSAGGALKQTGVSHWQTPNTGATNSSKFNAVGSGRRNGESFSDIQTNTYFWTSSTGDFFGANFARAVSYLSASIYQPFRAQTQMTGYAIRLLKNSTTLSDGQSSTYTGNDGKVYSTICINNQEWLAENLKETKYRDGGLIIYTPDASVWVNAAYDDWFLPSKNELSLIYNNLYLHSVGVISPAAYWTSSEVDASNAYCNVFNSGGIGISIDKSSLNRIVAARTFTLTEVTPSYALRDVGQSGGLIFNVINNGNGTYTYYEHNATIVTTYPWSNVVALLGNTSIAVGSGNTNTQNIIAQAGHTNSSALICSTFLPDIIGMFCIYNNDTIYA